MSAWLRRLWTAWITSDAELRSELFLARVRAEVACGRIRRVVMSERMAL